MKQRKSEEVLAKKFSLLWFELIDMYYIQIITKFQYIVLCDLFGHMAHCHGSFTLPPKLSFQWKIYISLGSKTSFMNLPQILESVWLWKSDL